MGQIFALGLVLDEVKAQGKPREKLKENLPMNIDGKWVYWVLDELWTMSCV